MSGEIHPHEEIESDDGGVPLQTSGSEEMDVESQSSLSQWTTTASTISENMIDSGGDIEAVNAPSTNEEADLPQELFVEEGISDDLNIIADEVVTDILAGPDLEDVLPASTAIFGMPELPSQDAGLNPLASTNEPTHYHLLPPYAKNFDCETLFRFWRRFWIEGRDGFPAISEFADPKAKLQRPLRVSGRTSDIQGIDWTRYQVTREMARSVRKMTTKNYTNMIEESEEHACKFGTPSYAASYVSSESPALARDRRFFRYSQTTNKFIPYVSHQQLRHNLSASSKSALFYFNSAYTDSVYDSDANAMNTPSTSASWRVKCLNSSTDTARTVMEVDDHHGISCLSADHGILIAGGYRDGTYMMKSIADSPRATSVSGTLNTSRNGGVNHAHTFLQRRSGLPQSAICANDQYIKVVDCGTNKVVQSTWYPNAVNCSAMSPDGRLRVLVSDDQWPLVVDADDGEVLTRLPGHKDHGFACAFSPDGVTMATGHQDGVVRVWDARQMKSSVHALPGEMSGIRSLAFSPIGSGYPVLIMAEPVDYVSIVDARTFECKQDIDFFGEVAGFSMPPEDRSLFIGNADFKYGGIMEFERTGEGRLTDGFETEKRRKEKSNHRPEEGPPQHSYRPLYVDVDDKTSKDIYNQLPEWFPTGPSRRFDKEALWKHEEKRWHAAMYDWVKEADVDIRPRISHSRAHRWRRHLGLGRLRI